MNDELLEYRQKIQLAIQLDSNIRIDNGNEDHALIIIDEMLKNAKKSVKIFCHNLLKSVYDSEQILQSLFLASSRGVKIDVISQKTPEADQFVKYASLDNSVTVYDAKAGGFSDIVGLNHNFAVMDGSAFRFEPIHAKAQAYACMNDSKSVTALTELFDMLKGRFK